MAALRQTLLICAAELLAEWRNRQVITTMVLIAALITLTFAFSGRAGASRLAPPALWVSLVLAAAAGAAQTIPRQGAAGVGAALRLGGAPGWAVFLGRLASFFLLLLLTAGLGWALTATVFGSLSEAPGTLAALLALGSLGLATLCTTVATAVSGPGDARPGMARSLPLMLIPLALPLVLVGARGTWSLCSVGAGLATAPATATAPAMEALALLSLMDAALLGLGVVISRTG